MSGNTGSLQEPSTSPAVSGHVNNSSGSSFKSKNNPTKHKKHSHSNINNNKQHKKMDAKTGFSSQNQFFDHRKLPKSKKNISNWMNSMYENDTEDYSAIYQKGKNAKESSGNSYSGDTSRSRRKSGGSNNGHTGKKTGGFHNRHQQHTKLYLSGDSYINANYKILTSGDKSSLVSDKGVIPFEDIERCVSYHNETNAQNCPICLSDDISCGRMANCGHIFCYSCLLQYVDNTERSHEQEAIELNRKTNNNAVSNADYFKKRILHECPLCGDIINLKHIVPVSRVYDYDLIEPVKEGKTVTLQLMVRPKTCTLALPVEIGFDPELVKLPMKYDPSSIIDIKLQNSFVLTPAKNIEFLKKDIENLKEQSQLDQLLYSESDEFVLKAIANIERKIDELSASTDPSPDPSPDPPYVESEYDDLSAAYVGSETLLKKYDDSNAYFYYQHIDLQANITFLEGQDVTILKKQNQQYSKFPTTLDVQVQHIVYDNQVNSHSMQYLNHLPFGSIYKLIEINLQPHISPELYQFYKPLLKSRVKLHERIKRQENVNKIKGEKQQLANLMKQMTDDLNMTPLEQAQHIHEPMDFAGELPTLDVLKRKFNPSQTDDSSVDNLKVEDFKVGDRVRMDGEWYTLRKSIWGELHFEKDRRVVVNDSNGELLELFQKQMKVSEAKNNNK